MVFSSTHVLALGLLAIATDASDFINTDECGKSMGCWTFPTHCKAQKCHGIVRWQLEGDQLHLELQAKDLDTATDVGRYISLGISEDAYMDNDTVIECVFGKDNSVNAFVSYNDHHDNVQMFEASRLLELESAARHDSRLLCRVTLDYARLRDVASGERATVKDVRRPGDAWTLIFAQGASDLKTGEKYMHAYYPWSTEELVEFCEDCERAVMVVDRTFPQRARRMRR